MGEGWIADRSRQGGKVKRARRMGMPALLGVAAVLLVLGCAGGAGGGQGGGEAPTVKLVNPVCKFLVKS